MKTEIFISIIGILTIVSTLILKLVGFPHQVKENYTRKSTKGVSTVFFALVFWCYSLWTLYGILKKDMIISIGHGMGIIVSGIILIQIIIYRKNK